jgi:recombination protein RecA
MALPAALHSLHPKISLGTPDRAKILPVVLGDVLPDGGLPRGAVVEVASPRALGRATTIALRACAAAQAEGRLRAGVTSTPREAGGERAKHPWVGGVWCAFVDPWSTLHAPAVVARGVDATRLLVVRPPLGALARVVVRLAESRVFSVIVVDTAGVPGAASSGALDLGRWSTVVRRVALAVERTDTTVILLTDATVRRAMPLPVALRLEVEPKGPGLVSVRVAKERHGRLTGTQLVELERAG